MTISKDQMKMRIRQSILSVDQDAEVTLFGSRARGDERSESDWDILILTDQSVDRNKEKKFRDTIYDLELESGEALSLFVYSKSDWYSRQQTTPFFQQIRMEGQRL